MLVVLGSCICISTVADWFVVVWSYFRARSAVGGSGRKELVTQVQEGLQTHHQFPMACLGGSLTNWSGVSVAPDDHAEDLTKRSSLGWVVGWIVAIRAIGHMALGNSHNGIMQYVGGRWVPSLPVLQSGKVFSNEPRTGIFRLESVNASNYGSAESLFLAAPPTEDTSPSGLELRVASISRCAYWNREYCLRWWWWWREWCISEKVASFSAGNIWVLNVTGMQNLMIK